MSKIWVKLYGEFRLTGTDFAPVNSTQMHRTVFSPDGKHSISVVGLRDGTLLLTNENDIGFNFSLGRSGRVLAVVKYYPNGKYVTINNNWKVKEDGVSNREIHTNPDLLTSEHLHIDLNVDGLGRIDLKLDNSGFAGAFFTTKELVFVRMNGHHAFPRLTEFIGHEAERLPPTEETKKRIGQKFFADWLATHEWGFK